MITRNSKKLKAIIILLICIQIFSSSRCNQQQVKIAFNVAKGSLQTVLKNNKNVESELEVFTMLPKKGYMTLTTIDDSYTKKFDLSKIKKALDASKNKEKLSLENWNYWGTLPITAIVSAREFAKQINKGNKKGVSFDEKTKIFNYTAPIEIEGKTYMMDYSVDLTQHFKDLEKIKTAEIVKIGLKISDNIKPLERTFTPPQDTISQPDSLPIPSTPSPNPQKEQTSPMQKALDSVLQRYSNRQQRGGLRSACNCTEVLDSSDTPLKVALYKNGKLWKVNTDPWNGATRLHYDLIDNNFDGKPDSK